MTRFVTLALALMIAISGLSGCMQTHTQRSTLFGGAAGAAVGGLATQSVGGAVVGGGIGALGGYLVGKNSHPCWKRNIFTGRSYRGWCLN